MSDGVSDSSTSQLAMEINRTFDALMMDMLLLRAQKLSDQTPETLATLVCPKTGCRSVSGMSMYTNTCNNRQVSYVTPCSYIVSFS